MATYEEITQSILSSSHINEILDKSTLSAEDKYKLIHRIVAEFSGIRRKPSTVYNKVSLPTSYVSFDIETTGLSYEDTMIQIAGVKYENGIEVETFMSYVNPGEIEISTPISYLTGVTADHVANAPTLEVAVDLFLEFIGDLPLIGHNVFSFEIPRFNRWAGIDLSNRVAVDTLNFAQTLPIEVENYKLETLKEYYAISNRSHDALEDSRITAMIYENFRNKNLDRALRQEDFEQIFEGLTFCYSGALKMSRKQLEAAIIARGGKITKSMTKRVNYFISAPQIAKNLTDGKRSKKEIVFDELCSSGHDIKLLSEDEFMKLLEG